MKYSKAIVVSLLLYVTPSSTDPACLPLTTNSNLCGTAADSRASDGYDEICTLTLCCTGSIPPSVKLGSGVVQTCSNVNCVNVCNLALARNDGSLGAGQKCNTVCQPPDRTPAGPFFSFDGGFCAGAEASTNGKVKWGIFPNLGVSLEGSQVGCGPSLDGIESEVRIPRPRHFKFPFPNTVGATFCCGISLSTEGKCDLDCSGELGAGYKQGDCSFSKTLWKAPCSALEGFSNIYSLAIPGFGGSGLLPPPALCFSGRCCDTQTPCNPNACDNLGLWARDSIGAPICNLVPHLLTVGTKCHGPLHSCCKLGYCHPWCYVQTDDPSTGCAE